jgi:hypothetical protein
VSTTARINPRDFYVTPVHTGKVAGPKIKVPMYGEFAEELACQLCRSTVDTRLSWASPGELNLPVYPSKEVAGSNPAEGHWSSVRASLSFNNVPTTASL